MANAKSLLEKLPGFFTVDEACDLAPDNAFTIVFADLMEVGQGAQAEDKPVLAFAETKKRLVLNKGRGNQLATLFGDDDLVGKVIRLTVEKIQGTVQIVVVSPE
jgi:hypothetical protein